jgi:hypothetical protein
LGHDWATLVFAVLGFLDEPTQANVWEFARLLTFSPVSGACRN